MCFILVSVCILSLQISEGTIILENFNYTSNERYLIIDLSIFNDSHGSIFYNLNKTFKTNLVLKTTVKIYCKIFNWKYCKHFNYFKDLIALYRAEENSNIYEKFIYFAKATVKRVTISLETSWKGLCGMITQNMYLEIILTVPLPRFVHTYCFARFWRDSSKFAWFNTIQNSRAHFEWKDFPLSTLYRKSSPIWNFG